MAGGEGDAEEAALVWEKKLEMRVVWVVGWEVEDERKQGLWKCGWLERKIKTKGGGCLVWSLAKRWPRGCLQGSEVVAGSVGDGESTPVSLSWAREKKAKNSSQGRAGGLAKMQQSYQLPFFPFSSPLSPTSGLHI
ncbi:hypothetical protein Peur_001636 [Populus x canadensis]